MTCQYCSGNCRKAGKQANGSQKLYCKACKKYQQSSYHKKAYGAGINTLIRKLLCESVGIRGIGRILHIATGTVIRRIKKIAAAIVKPASILDRPCFEVDELWTFIGKKSNEYWVAYALDRENGNIIDFIVGKRTKHTINGLFPKVCIYLVHTVLIISNARICLSEHI